MPPDESSRSHLAYLTYLFNAVSNAFSVDEIQTMCFSLGIDYEDLPGDGKLSKCRNLVQLLRRRDELHLLEDYCAKTRADNPWDYWTWLHSTGTLGDNGNAAGRIDGQYPIGEEIDESYLSEQLRSQLLAIGKVIEQLTNDQYEILRWLRNHRRASIAGCAGSGKTLVAAEKSIRLDQEGRRTLFLTHNPHLADYVRRLVSRSTVQVYDFTYWVAQLVSRTPTDGDEWSHLIEPTDEELETAFDRLTQASDKFDAIIVDEGQDFRDTWWLVIEAALADSRTGILYIFHDDNQALLPQRGKYPIADAPFVLSRNCRNAGQVFEFVRRFHAQAPESSILLSDQGIVRQSIFVHGEEREAISDAVREALKAIGAEQLVVLTTEQEPVQTSMLEGLAIVERPPWRWQDAVRIYLGARLSLSDSPYPTSEDLVTVTRFARGVVGASARAAKLLGAYTLDWRVKDQTKLVLVSYPRGLSFNMLRFAAFFSNDTWADGIPRPRVFHVSSSKTSDASSSIGLHTTASFKGLESDGVILFVRAQRDELDANLYVGISRARFLLHCVVESQVYSRSTVLQLREHP